MNGPQNTVLTPAMATSALVLVVEGIAIQVMAKPTIARLAVASASRLTAAASLVCVPYFM